MMIDDKRLRELCARVLHAKESSEFQKAVAELAKALESRENDMDKNGIKVDPEST